MLTIGSVSIVNNKAVNTVNTSRRTDSTVAGSKAENEKLNRQIKIKKGVFRAIDRSGSTFHF